MENSPRYRDDAHNLLPSPSSSCITTSTQPAITRSESTIFVKTNACSFKQVVQMLTSSKKPPNYPNPTHQLDRRYSIPPNKAVPNKKKSSSSSSGLSIYKCCDSKKHPNINPVHNQVHFGLPEKLSPSILDFSSMVLSPNTTLVPDPFYRFGSINQSPVDFGLGHYDPKHDSDVEEREIREKGFYLYPSPSSTPKDSEPRLLNLFPLTSSQVSDSPATSP